MEYKGFQFKDDIPFGDLMDITKAGDHVSQMLEFAKRMSCLGPEEFLIQLAKRPTIEAMEIIAFVQGAHQKRMREAAAAIAEQFKK